jgi:O-methyltransferase involved in polyketide biosynthesis
MGVLDDPFARGMLTPSMGVVLRVVEHGPHRLRTSSVTLAGLAARVLWFDAQVAATLGDRIGQVTVIGAGHDSRAWRMRRGGVQFFELDHAATQRDKARRAPRAGPV